MDITGDVPWRVYLVLGPFLSPLSSPSLLSGHCELMKDVKEPLGVGGREAALGGGPPAVPGALALGYET